jgi:aerobic-type carbon monoxide dehydrogenase small subunit (CoxS/CutS family)
MVRLSVNGVDHDLDVPDEMPLLWAIRDVVGLTGTKFGCGIAACGACTVHLDGIPARSCVVAVKSAVGKKITTIEGLAPLDKPHPVQVAWVEHNVPQCGYCQSGQIMAAAALLARTPHPSDSDIDVAMTNICRCGCYPRIKDAIKSAAGVA